MAEIQQIMASGIPWQAATQIAQAQAGSGGSIFGSEGNINVQISSAGINPASTGSDIVVAAFTLPSLSFDTANRGLEINVYGSTASNTNTKTMKVIVGATTATVGSAVSGGTTIATAAIATTAGSGGWSIGAMVYKYGAAGSNTQQAIHFAAQTGNTVAALTAPQNLTLSESAAILIAVTINAATTATDATFSMLQINWTN